MQITASRPMITRATSPAPEEPVQEDGGLGGKLKDYAVLGGVSAACGGIGYVGGMAHNIPFVGPVISGGIGAVAGASAGATVATMLPGQKIKLGAVLGGLGGAILGASAGGNVATNVLMAAGAATAPYGLLLAVFSGAE